MVDSDFENFGKDPINQDLQFDYDTEKDDLGHLKSEIRVLKKQVKYLKKMAVVNMFESREEFKEFFSDIW